MLMLQKSPWLSMSTIIRYPQREIEKLIMLWVLYLSGPLEMASVLPSLRRTIH